MSQSKKPYNLEIAPNVVVLLVEGQSVIISEKDLAIVSTYHWHINNTRGYVQSSIYCNGKTKNVKMHRLILGILDPKIKIDHQNGNQLDNRRENLREASPSSNAANARKRKGKCTSKYKGVFLHKNSGKWAAKIKSNYKETWLGYFDKEKDAALAYDKKAKEVFGSFAKLNLPDYKKSKA